MYSAPASIAFAELNKSPKSSQLQFDKNCLRSSRVVRSSRHRSTRSMSWPLGNVMSAWHPGLSSSRLCSVAQIRVRILYLLGPFLEWLAISLANSASHTLSTRGWARLIVDAQNCPSLPSYHVLIIPLWGLRRMRNVTESRHLQLPSKSSREPWNAAIGDWVSATRVSMGCCCYRLERGWLVSHGSIESRYLLHISSKRRGSAE